MTTIKTNCVSCSVEMKSKGGVPCCARCRQLLTYDDKVALGVVKPAINPRRLDWSDYHRKRNPFTYTCKACGVEFQSRSPRRVYCDNGCYPPPKDTRKNQRKMSKRRAMIAQAFVEEVDPTTLFERDGWRCHICGKKCRQDVDNFHPKAPTIDHIIPLVAGGEHSYKNTACAHRYCNVSKGARDIGQQLAIVG